MNVGFEGLTAFGMKGSACRFLAWLIDPEDGADMLFQNVSLFSSNYTPLYPRTLQINTCLSDPQGLCQIPRSEFRLNFLRVSFRKNFILVPVRSPVTCSLHEEQIHLKYLKNVLKVAGSIPVEVVGFIN
jgi:hypothetical protein